MKRTGEYLKNAREEKGLSLHEIGLALKINTKVLKAIEESDLANLPAKTFLRGFVKSYAHYLKLDTQVVLNIFTEEMGSTQPKPLLTEDAQTGPAEPVESGPRARNDIKPLGAQHNSTRTIIIVSLGIALVSMILFTKKIVDRYSREAQVESVTALDPISTSENDTEDIAQISSNLSLSAEDKSDGLSLMTGAETSTGTPASGTPVPATESGVPITSVLTNQTSTTATPPTPAPAPSPTPTVTPPPQPQVTANSTNETVKNASQQAEPQKPDASKTLVPQKGKNVELIVEAMSAVEIEYASASGKPVKIRLSPEQVHTFKSKDGLSVKISNGGAVNLIHNGKDLGIPGDLGKPLQLNY